MTTRSHYQETTSRLMHALETTPAAQRSEEALPFDLEQPPRGPQDSDFYPTGNETLDRIVRAAAPEIRYGRNPANNWPGDSEINECQEIDGTFGWIGMPFPDQFGDVKDYRAILAHELIHWTKTQGRSARPHAGATQLDMLFGIVPDGYAREELVAEIGAAILLDVAGEPQDLAARAAYINNWRKAIPDDERAEALEWATDKAQAAVDWLMQFDHD